MLVFLIKHASFQTVNLIFDHVLFFPHTNGLHTPHIAAAWPFNCCWCPHGANKCLSVVIHDSISVRQNTQPQSDRKAFTESAHLLEMMLPRNNSPAVCERKESEREGKRVCSENQVQTLLTLLQSRHHKHLATDAWRSVEVAEINKSIRKMRRTTTFFDT